jgi:DNA-directed RNA polymerase specialized sigma subunit
MKTAYIDETALLERYIPVIQHVTDSLRESGFLAATLGVDSAAIGRAALKKAICNFDPEQDATFASYAARCVRSAICDAIRALNQEAGK